MKINFATDASNAFPQCPIDYHRLCPGLRIMITHVAPASVIVKRASDAGRFRGRRIIMTAQPGQAIAPAHALFDQRPTIDLPVLG